jgi:two-component system, OmpR family, sensor histidine kinase KdpD
MSDASEPRRPDPERLLKMAQAEESPRGKLKIFFGYAAGVGKTYAMLSEARREREQGVDVVAGYIEPHARPETMELIEGLQTIPPRMVDHRGITLQDFDLDAAIGRKPALVLVDELAHTNAPGMRHAKRWQDVRELLDQGISVYTSLNVQHLESLSDVVASITGVVVGETVPDALFDEADSIELIDLPPEELEERFREGKVYVPAQAETAMRNFFRRPRLVALREIALRRMAEQVNRSVQDMRLERPGAAIWPTVDTLLVCVGASPSSATVIRKARRMAAALHARWVALNVRRPGATLAAGPQERLQRNLTLAESLGAEVAVIQAEGTDAAASIVSYARLRNVTKIVIGKNLSPFSPLRHIRGDLVDRLLHASGDIDVYVIPGEAEQVNGAQEPRARGSWAGAAGATLVMAAAIALAVGVRNLGFELPNVIMTLLLGVVVCSIWFGSAAGIVATAASVLGFNFFFTEPYFSLAISDTQYVVTFVIMLLVALTLSTLTSRVKRQAVTARQQEWRTDALYRLSKVLSRTPGKLQIATAARDMLAGTLRADFALFLDEGGRVLKVEKSSLAPVDAREEAVVTWVLRNEQPAGQGTGTLSAAPGLYLPLKGSREAMGVLSVRFHNPRDLAYRDIRNLIETFAAQIAIALEREELTRTTQEVMVKVEGERLRSSLLRSISHDLRTPLTGIAGSASALLHRLGDQAGPDDRALLEGIADEAAVMTRTFDNLLSLTRLETEGVELRKDPEAVDDVVSAALERAARRTEGHEVRVCVPEDVLLVSMESGLIEQVLVNLIDNAAKFSAPSAPIEVSVRRDEAAAVFEVADRGHGIPAGERERIFEKFYRLREHDGRTRGTGLGLSICRAIVNAHGGTISVHAREGGGSRFVFTLPLHEGAADGH